MAFERKRRGSRFGSAVLSAAATALVFARYRRDIARAKERVATGGRIAATALGPIEYAEAGAGPAVLVVHGAGGGYDQGIDLGSALAERFRLIAMSRFGYLGTPLPADAGAAAQADAHAALLDALGIERAAVIGASAGAPSAMQLALRHPHRLTALVLLVPAAYVPRAGGAPPVVSSALVELASRTVLRSDFAFWALSKLSPETLVRSILATPAEVLRDAGPEERERVRRIVAGILPVSERRLGLANDTAVCSSLPRYELESIRAPTLAVSFEDDLYGTYEAARYTCEHVPNARFVGFPRGGHVWIGHQRDVMREVADFVQAVRS